MRAMQRWAHICLSKKGRLVFVSDHQKVQRHREREGEKERDKGSKVGSRQGKTEREGARLNGGREQVALPKAIKV